MHMCVIYLNLYLYILYIIFYIKSTYKSKYNQGFPNTSHIDYTYTCEQIFLPHSLLHLPIPTSLLSCSYTSICGTAFSPVIYKLELLFLTYHIKRINKNFKKTVTCIFHHDFSHKLSPCSLHHLHYYNFKHPIPHCYCTSLSLFPLTLPVCLENDNRMI